MSETSSEGHVPMELAKDEKAYASLGHARMISTSWIGLLTTYLLRKQSRFVSFHALQALCGQIIYTFLYRAGMAVFFAVMFSTVLSLSRGKVSTPGAFPIVLLSVVFPIYSLLIMGGLAISKTLGSVYCVKPCVGNGRMIRSSAVG